MERRYIARSTGELDLKEQKTDQGRLTIETVRKAIMGATISNSGELYASYGEIPQQCIDAACIICDNYAEFEKILIAMLLAIRTESVRYCCIHWQARKINSRVLWKLAPLTTL